MLGHCCTCVKTFSSPVTVQVIRFDECKRGTQRTQSTQLRCTGNRDRVPTQLAYSLASCMKKGGQRRPVVLCLVNFETDGENGILCFACGRK